MFLRNFRRVAPQGKQQLASLSISCYRNVSWHTVSLGKHAFPYVLYNDLENQLHEDYAAGAMLGAYINGTSYMSS